MKSLHKSIAIAILAIGGCALAQCQESTFIMRLRVQSPEGGVAKPGESIVLEVSMLNRSDRTLKILEGNPAEDYQIDIRDSSGAHPADTDYGLSLKKSAASPEKFVVVNRKILLSLKPAETGTDVIPISLMYDLRSPGKYFVTVERKLPKELGPGTVRSNEVIITVTEQK